MELQKTPEDTEDDIVQAFRVFDSDNKGYIESAELRELLENMDWKVSADELKDLITSANLHQDRRIGMEGIQNRSKRWNLTFTTQSLQLYKFKLAFYYADSESPQSQSKTRLNLEARLYHKKNRNVMVDSNQLSA